MYDIKQFQKDYTRVRSNLETIDDALNEKVKKIDRDANAAGRHRTDAEEKCCNKIERKRGKIRKDMQKLDAMALLHLQHKIDIDDLIDEINVINVNLTSTIKSLEELEDFAESVEAVLSGIAGIATALAGLL